MTKHTAEELNSCSKEQLVNIVLDMQDRFTILEERIAAMAVNTYGVKSEKLPPSPDQYSLFNEVEAVVDEATTEEVEEPEEVETVKSSQKKKKGKRKADLSKFPKDIIKHELSEEELKEIYGDEEWKLLGYQIYSKLEVIPTQYRVKEHQIAIYSGVKSEKIVKAKHPPELINNSIASSSSVAGIMNAKYTNAMPLYRIEKEFENNGVSISRQNMANWVIRCSERYLSLVVDRLHELLLEGHVIQADETPCYVSKDGRPAGSKSEMWVYRTGEYNKEKPIIIYKYETGRSADCAIMFLDKFKGFLECDAYGAYRKLGRVNPDITVCSCWAHARRSFSDAVKAYGVKAARVQDTLAYRALEKIALIYSADEKLKQYSPEERLKRRQTTVKRKVDDFFIWAKQHQNDTGCKDLTWEGFSYCINNEDYLRRFLCDGEIPIDNSASERAIRPFTVSRKTWKLIDTPSGAEASAIIYSLVETAKANGLKVYDYLKFLLDEIPKHMDGTDKSFIDSLLPWSKDLPDSCFKPKTK